MRRWPLSWSLRSPRNPLSFFLLAMFVLCVLPISWSSHCVGPFSHISQCSQYTSPVCLDTWPVPRQILHPFLGAVATRAVGAGARPFDLVVAAVTLYANLHRARRDAPRELAIHVVDVEVGQQLRLLRLPLEVRLSSLHGRRGERPGIDGAARLLDRSHECVLADAHQGHLGDAKALARRIDQEEPRAKLDVALHESGGVGEVAVQQHSPHVSQERITQRFRRRGVSH